MRFIRPSRSCGLFKKKLKYLVPLTVISLSLPALAGSVSILSPAPTSTNVNAVRIAASSNERGAYHLELWDNGNKLGNVFSSSVNSVYNLPSGSHITTVLAVSNKGAVLNQSSVTYKVADQNQPAADSVSISSPASGSTSISAVNINASANESGAFHLEIWDNGFKLGDVPSNSVNGVYVLPSGSHSLTVYAVANSGKILGRNTVSYTVAENCGNSGSAACNLDQEAIDNTQSYCDPPLKGGWLANPCGPGVQGPGGRDPKYTTIQATYGGGAIPDQGNLTLNGRSVHLLEAQGSQPSNVLFRAQSARPASKSSVDSHWTLDGYVYLPNPAAHQAFEMDAQYSIHGIWTKFYTECAFNMQSGRGYWAVFDSETGGWIFLNGRSQNGQTPPVVPCNRSQFSQPWSGSGNPSFSGWHHIVWKFVRNNDGTVTYQSLTFDANTTQVNFRPRSQPGGWVSDNGNFSALVQLDGVVNPDGKYDTVDAYVSELNLTHTP